METLKQLFTLTDETTTLEECKQLIDELDNDSVCTLLNIYTAITESDSQVWMLLGERHNQLIK